MPSQNNPGALPDQRVRSAIVFPKGPHHRNRTATPCRDRLHHARPHAKVASATSSFGPTKALEANDSNMMLSASAALTTFGETIVALVAVAPKTYDRSSTEGY